MKPNKDYKISKETKRMFLILSGEKKTNCKKLMIEAELFEKQSKMARMKERNTGDNLGE